MEEVENVEIKHEFDAVGLPQCCACLSIGRKLICLKGEHARIYQKISSEVVHFNAMSTVHEVCWECYGILHKIVQFQQKVARATDILQLGQNYMYGTLSNLTTVVINDSHPHIIYIHEQVNAQTNITKSETFNTNFENDDISYDHICDNIEETSENYLNSTGAFDSNIKKESSRTEKKEKFQSKSLSRWAQKRAKENKKAKYKIVSLNEINNIYRRYCMTFKEVEERLKRDRRSCQRKYECQICTLSFVMKIDLLNHVCDFHGTNQHNFICDICTLNFKNKRHLSAHMKKHYYMYECSVCQYSCFSNKVIKNHVNKNHKKVYECLKCGLKFGTSNEFFKHYKDWHERFICDHCGVSFKMKYCIKEHIKKQHRKFECLECKKQFARYNGLWLHRKTTHATTLTAAYCVECDKRFPDIYRYRWHLANSVKHKLKPNKKIRIPCKECDKVFSKKIYMTEHYNLVHLKLYKYRCEDCNKNFLRNADLVNHRKRVHEGILPPKNKICYMCGRGFTTNKILVNHVRTHTGERPHACARCPAAFAQRAALAAHRRALHRPHNH